MRLDDFNNIDFKNVGNLPWPVKAVLLALLGLILLGLGYWFLLMPALDDLDQAKAKENELKQTFLAKKSQAVKLESYRLQMIEIEKTFGTLLKQLPDRSEMDGLLTDINQAGLGRGLEFELFKPGQETVAEFYAEMPIQIKVVGNYHDLGAFASDVSKLPRIVILNDVSIQALNEDSKGDDRLMMDVLAKTYRYLDNSEIAAKKAADKKAKVK